MHPPDTRAADHAAPPGRFSLPRFPVLFCGLTAASALAWTALASGSPVAGALALCFKLVTSAWMPALYLFASLGLGLRLLRWLAPSVTSRTIAVCTGVSLMLTLTHLLGWSGLLGGSKGPFVAWAPVVAGCWLAMRPASQWWEQAKTAPAPSRWWLALCPAFGLMLACACSTPGWLWGSEFGGFDALSYHLQLPQEWIASGRISPVRHNVYSYLPSYVESAFVHCSLLSFPARAGTESDWGFGLLAREGQGLIAAQLLHSGLGMIAALGLGRAATELTRRALEGGSLRSDDPRMAASMAGAVAAGLFAWTPWTVVVGTLAYNEMALLLMIAGTVMAFVLPISARARWCLVALFIGAACGAKLTALLFAGIPAAVALLVVSPRRGVLTHAALAVAIGLLMLAPWMARNALDTGNPVFPFAAGFFKNSAGGTGHWSAEQVARFAASHRFSGGVGERLRLAVFSTPDPGNPTVEVHRGLMHPQWGYLFPMLGLGVVGLLPRWQAMPRAGRAAAALLMAGVVLQLALWLFTTHIQSRFLLPLLPGAAVLIALCVGLVDAANLRSGAAVALVGTQAFFMYNTLAQQHPLPQGGSVPLGAVPVGATAFTGEIYARGTPALEDILSPEQWVNVSLKGGTHLLLVGDCAPLYFRHQPAYATTWDENPLARILTQSGADNPDAISTALRAEGFDFVLVNINELARYDRSGFLDRRLLPSNLKQWIEQSTVAAKAMDGGGRLLLRPLLPAERDALRARQKAQPPAAPPG